MDFSTVKFFTFDVQYFLIMKDQFELSVSANKNYLYVLYITMKLPNLWNKDLFYGDQLLYCSVQKSRKSSPYASSSFSVYIKNSPQSAIRLTSMISDTSIPYPI